MYCKFCGKAVGDHDSFCGNCGAKLDNAPTENSSEDSSSLGFAILGFFIPIVGLILYLVYEEKQPKLAKSAGKGALIGFIIRGVLSIAFVIMYFVFLTSFFW